jgi:hypothetical protein
MSYYDVVRMYWFVHSEITKDRDTLAGVPRSRSRERRLRDMVQHLRTLEIHRPAKEGSRMVCHGCLVLVADLSDRTRYLDGPCEHVALIAFVYSDRPGFDPEWIKPYAWAVSP